MVRLSCEAVCVSGNSTILCELLLNHTCFGKTLFVGQNVLVKIENSDEHFQCRISRSLAGDDVSRLVAPNSIIGDMSGSLIVHIIELRCGIYTIPLAATVVFTVHPKFRNLVSPSILKRLLCNRIITEKQSISHPSRSRTAMSIKTVHGYGNNVAYVSDIKQFFKVCRRTQIIVEFELNGDSEMVAPGLTTAAYSDAHSSIKVLINMHLTNPEYFSSGVTRKRARTIPSVLLEGEGGPVKSLIVQKEAHSANVSVQKIVLTSLLHLDHLRLSQMLNSIFVSVFSRQPCILLIESLEILKGLPVTSELALIVKRVKWFLNVFSGLNNSFLPISRSLLPISVPRVMVFACTESTEQVDVSLTYSFDEKVFLSGTNLGDSRLVENLTMYDIKQKIQDVNFSRPHRSFLEGNECTYVNFRRRLTSSQFSDIVNSYVLSDSEILAAVQDILLIPRHFPSIFREYGIPPPTGILLYGPSGTGKTMLVKSILKEASGSFINIKLSDVISGSVGEASNIIRSLFLKAKKQSPTVVFIDEFQALFSARDEGVHSFSKSSDGTLIFTLIGCLDDISLWNSCAGPGSIVTVIAATNEPWAVDEILLRSGRFDKVVLIGTMSHPSRQEILRKLLNGVKDDIPVNVDTHTVALNSEGFTGADMNILFQKACCLYTEQHRSRDRPVCTNLSALDDSFFEKVLEKMGSSCSHVDLMDYKSWGRDFQTRVW